jgi:hypothetical protein
MDTSGGRTHTKKATGSRIHTRKATGVTRAKTEGRQQLSVHHRVYLNQLWDASNITLTGENRVRVRVRTSYWMPATSLSPVKITLEALGWFKSRCTVAC